MSGVFVHALLIHRPDLLVDPMINLKSLNFNRMNSATPSPPATEFRDLPGFPGLGGAQGRGRKLFQAHLWQNTLARQPGEPRDVPKLEPIGHHGKPWTWRFCRWTSHPFFDSQPKSCHFSWHFLLFHGWNPGFSWWTPTFSEVNPMRFPWLGPVKCAFCTPGSPDSIQSWSSACRRRPILGNMETKASKVQCIYIYIYIYISIYLYIYIYISMYILIYIYIIIITIIISYIYIYIIMIYIYIL